MYCGLRYCLFIRRPAKNADISLDSVLTDSKAIKFSNDYKFPFFPCKLSYFFGDDCELKEDWH